MEIYLLKNVCVCTLSGHLMVKVDQQHNLQRQMQN